MVLALLVHTNIQFISFLRQRSQLGSTRGDIPLMIDCFNDEPERWANC